MRLQRKGLTPAPGKARRLIKETSMSQPLAAMVEKSVRRWRMLPLWEG